MDEGLGRGSTTLKPSSESFGKTEKVTICGLFDQTALEYIPIFTKMMKNVINFLEFK